MESGNFSNRPVTVGIFDVVPRSTFNLLRTKLTDPLAGAAQIMEPSSKFFAFGDQRRHHADQFSSSHFQYRRNTNQRVIVVATVTLPCDPQLPPLTHHQGATIGVLQ
jgi:hypothetical protein